MLTRNLIIITIHYLWLGWTIFVYLNYICEYHDRQYKYLYIRWRCIPIVFFLVLLSNRAGNEFWSAALGRGSIYAEFTIFGSCNCKAVVIYDIILCVRFADCGCFRRAHNIMYRYIYLYTRYLVYCILYYTFCLVYTYPRISTATIVIREKHKKKVFIWYYTIWMRFRPMIAYPYIILSTPSFIISSLSLVRILWFTYNTMYRNYLYNTYRFRIVCGKSRPTA